MGKFEKAIERLKKVPCDYTYDEARTVLLHMGFSEYTKGRTSGSRVVFIKDGKEEARILLHKPHPGNVMKQYAVRQLKEKLEELEEL